MKVKGIVTHVSPQYPYDVTVGVHKFKSEFMFTTGMLIDIEVIGGTFSHVGVRGFVISTPNGFSEYPVTDFQIKEVMEGRHFVYHQLPWFAVEAIKLGKKVVWDKVESFYRYDYSCEFDATRKVLTTNYAIR